MTTPLWHAPSLERAAPLFRGMHAANAENVSPSRQAWGVLTNTPPRAQHTAYSPAKSPADKALRAGPPPRGCQGPRQIHEAACSEALSTQDLSNPQCTSNTVIADKQRGPLGAHQMLASLLLKRLPVPGEDGAACTPSVIPLRPFPLLGRALSATLPQSPPRRPDPQASSPLPAA